MAKTKIEWATLDWVICGGETGPVQGRFIRTG